MLMLVGLHVDSPEHYKELRADAVCAVSGARLGAHKLEVVGFRGLEPCLQI